MGWWKKLVARDEIPVAISPSVVVPPPSPPDDVARLGELGTAGGPAPDEALQTLARLRRTPDEARALDALVLVAAARELPEAVALAVASALVDRGEPAGAERLLARATSPHALILLADLRAEAADFAGAIALVERVLLRDLEHPGARERHHRWRTAIGLGARPTRADASAPTMVTSEPDAPYVLLREVGRGGAGAVYEAEDRELGRRLALKVYHDPLRGRAQLEHEVKTAVLLAGSGVLRVFDADPEHGWISLEWAPLGSLRDRLRGDAAPLSPIDAWAHPLALTLARVHDAGWVHLDVKPANVLLAAADRPLLADFGTARRAGAPSTPGSLGYVAPERLAGAPSDPRDDVYGFGRLLEDALFVLAARETPEAHARLRAIASACVAPAGDRPADARAIAALLR